MKWYKDTAMHH